MEILGHEYRVGDKVWIERTEFVEHVDMIREPQVIEDIQYVEVVDERNRECLAQSITLKGSAFIYSHDDIKPL
jgi:hypothetical protein